MAKKLTPKEAEEIERAKKIVEILRGSREALNNPKIEDAPPAVQSVIKDYNERMEKSPLFESSESGPVEVKPFDKPKDLELTPEIDETKSSSISSKSSPSYTKEDSDVTSKKMAKARKDPRTLDPGQKVRSVTKKLNEDIIQNFGKGQELELPISPSTGKVAEEVVEESPFLRQFGSLSDDVMKRLDPAIQKVLQNKYFGKAVKTGAALAENPLVTKGLPVAGMVYEASQLPENLEDKQYIDAAGNVLGVAAGSAMLAGAAIPAMALGTTSAGIAGSKALGQYAAEHTKHTPEEIRGISQFADKLENNTKLQEKLGKGFGEKFNPPYGLQKNNPDYVNHLRKTGLSDDEIIKKVNQYEAQGAGSQINRTIDPDKIPSKAEVIEYAVQKAKQLNIDPAFALAQMQQESGFKLGAVSETGAKGLTQMFSGAFQDAKNVDEFGDLQNLDYNEVFGKDSNWKKQIDAGLLYNKAISKQYNKSGTEEEQLLRYHGGPSGTAESIGRASRNPNAHKEYVKSIMAFKNKWNDILNNEDKKNNTFNSLRTQKSEFFNPELTNDLSLIRDYLVSPTETEQDAFGKVISSGPFASGKNYGESISDADRLSNLKNLYLESRKQKEIVKSQTEPTKEETDFSDDINKLFDIEKGFTKNTVRDLASVQDTANQLRQSGLLLEAFEKMGRGISGAMSGIEVKAGERNKFLESQADAIEAQYKERAAKEADDPESQYSASLRNFAKPVLSRMGIADAEKLVDGMSGNQIAKILPQIKDMYEVEVRSKILKQQVGERKKNQQDLSDQRTYNQLPKTLETLGGLAGNRLRTRIQQSGNIYGTLGINPKDFNKMSDEQIEDTLDQKTKLQIVESALEVNSLLSNANSPAASTIEKLLLDSGWQRGMNAADFIANKQFGRDQGKYLKQILNMTARVEKTALDELHKMKVRTLSGYSRFAENPYIAGDFNNLLQQHGVSYDELQGKQKVEPAEEVSMSAKDKQAIHWAKQNLNNPNAIVSKKAKAIITHFGM
jgi:hypothetical protein